MNIIADCLKCTATLTNYVVDSRIEVYSITRGVNHDQDHFISLFLIFIIIENHKLMSLD